MCSSLTVLFLALLALGAHGLKVSVDIVDQLKGTFTVSVDGSVWMHSSDVFLRSSNNLWSTADGSLQLASITTSDGEDVLGIYSEINLHYVNKVGDAKMTGVIKQYPDTVVFEQSFPNPLLDTSSGNADGLVSGFPTFDMAAAEQSGASPAGFAHWISWFYATNTAVSSGRAGASQQDKYSLPAPGFMTPTFGRWSSNLSLPGGVGGSGTLCIFSLPSTPAATPSITSVLSPFDNAMAVSHASPSPGQIQYGLMGNITHIPAGTAGRVMLHFSSNGINHGMRSWGALVRKWWNKPDASVARQRDVTLQYLGFSTDNGMFYYYHTEPGTANYLETLVAVQQYAQTVGIPYRYVLLDSWWYYRGQSNDGVSNWTARPDIFPNGIQELYNQTGWLVQAHNRYWALETVYAKQNGGAYDFIMDHAKRGALPVQQEFWDDLFSAPKAEWGLRVYEQDWLFNEFYQFVGPLLESASLGGTWLRQMAAGAQKNGLTIQYCMPFIRHVLASAEFEPVTQARASDDYTLFPRAGYENWRIGGQSLLFDALGLAPSKDGFWSSSTQPGNPYGQDAVEPFPRLQSVVTTLSAGPVAIGDGIGFSDVALIMRSCRQDGLLLQPTIPATPIDSTMVEAATNTASGAAPNQIWFASSTVSGRTFGYLLAIEVQTTTTAGGWVVTPADLHGLTPSTSYYYAFETNSTDKPVIFDASRHLSLPLIRSHSDFQLWTIVPVERNGWALQGEVNKWTSVSAARYDQIDAFESVSSSSSSSGISVRAKGTAGEVIQTGFISPLGLSVTISCTFGPSRVLRVSSDNVCAEE